MGTVVDLVVALRREVLRRYPEYDTDAPGALDELATQADQAFCDLEDERVLQDRAVILLWRTNTAFQDDAQRARIEVALDDDEAVAWVATQMRELAPRFDASLELMLDAAHAMLLPHLAEAGLRPRMTLLHGTPRRALDGLRAGGLDPSALDDLQIESRASEAQIEQAAALLRDFFRRHPQLGYLPPLVPLTPGLQNRIDELTRETLRKTLEAGTAFVVLRGDDLLGQATLRTRDDALLGRVGGIAIGFTEEIQGRGIGKLVYEKLLERMIELDVAVMRGRTASPRVMHLAERMGRSVRGWQLERAR